MKKKVLAAFLASVMVFAMTGCSGGNQASSEPVEVTSIDDLADLTIGVQIGTTGDSAATDAVNEDSQVNRFNKGADAIQALKNGKYKLAIVFSSSIMGAYFEGAVGSELWIDEVEIKYEN